MRPLGGVESPVIDGQLFCSSIATREPRPSEPGAADLLQQALVLEYPADLPFAPFAGSMNSHSGGEPRESITMLLIDKVTGPTLTVRTNWLKWAPGNPARVSDPASHAVTIQVGVPCATIYQGPSPSRAAGDDGCCSPRAPAKWLAACFES